MMKTPPSRHFSGKMNASGFIIFHFLESCHDLFYNRFRATIFNGHLARFLAKSCYYEQRATIMPLFYGVFCFLKMGLEPSRVAELPKYEEIIKYVLL